MAKEDEGEQPRKDDDPYCEFRDDRERRNALMSRDVRIVLCRLFTVAGIVVVAFLSPGAKAVLIRLSTLL